jgi:antitoxin component of MazEF toxin-antitoxin module
MPEHHGIITEIETDEEDNLVLNFPTELLEALGWEEGDYLDIQVFAGRIILSKLSDEGTPDSSGSEGPVS